MKGTLRSLNSASFSLPRMRPLFMANGPAFKKNYVHRTPFLNIDVYSLACSVLHLNLDPDREQSNPSYCRNDGQPSRVQKMLEPLKYLPKNGTDKNSLNRKEDNENDEDGGWFDSKLKGYLVQRDELEALQSVRLNANSKLATLIKMSSDSF